jgi:16S rRNA (uracil1498-N3)-methyltransferase
MDAMTEQISAHRLYVDTPLKAGAVYFCTAPQNNYLLNVLRLSSGTKLLVFNGFDGEWLAELRTRSKKSCDLVAREQVREQTGGPRLHYLFAPLKRARLDYMVQKATELGVEAIQPVITRRTNIARIKEQRLQANIIEAAEQCGVLRLPRLEASMKLVRLLDDWDADIPILFCDEGAPITSPLAALEKFDPGQPTALLIGPEGGFDDEERSMLLDMPFVRAISLGPRIMRADTAAVAALALVNAVLFDWR